MIFLDTTHGLISSRYIVRLKSAGKPGGGWNVYYQAGAEVMAGHCTDNDADEFFRAIARSGR